MGSKNQLNYFYDQEVDVLYISKDEPSKTDISDKLEDEIVARYNAKTKQIKGLTILNFALRSKKNARTVKLPFEINFRPVN